MLKPALLILGVWLAESSQATEPAAPRTPVEVAMEARSPQGALQEFQQGVELARAGDYQAALARFQRASELSPYWALPYLEIAVAHMMTDNDLAIIGGALNKAVKYGDEIPRAHYLFGIYLQETDKRSEAIAELVRALQLRPSLEDARFRLATLFVEDGRQAEGIQQYLLLLQQRPSHVGAHRNLAVLFEQSGQLEDAEGHLMAITWLFPDNAYHLNNLARFYQRVGWEAKAKAAFAKAKTLEPGKDKRKLRPLLPSRDR